MKKVIAALLLMIVLLSSVASASFFPGVGPAKKPTPTAPPAVYIPSYTGPSQQQQPQQYPVYEQGPQGFTPHVVNGEFVLYLPNNTQIYQIVARDAAQGMLFYCDNGAADTFAVTVYGYDSRGFSLADVEANARSQGMDPQYIMLEDFIVLYFQTSDAELIAVFMGSKTCYEVHCYASTAYDNEQMQVTLNYLEDVESSQSVG